MVYFMASYQEVQCPHCQSNDVIKIGRTKQDIQRYRCRNTDCSVTSFQLEYQHKAYYPHIKTQMIDMAINGSGIRDTARVLGINKNTVIRQLKKRQQS
jgi:transposase-like protein